jgi:hypothetical protein
LLCTVGGLLVFGKNPEKRLPQNGVNFAHFKGIEITDELVDKKVITGRIQDIAEQLMVVFKNNMKTPSVINGLNREEKEEYPSLVLREAIVNTLVHRNYSISGSKIRIFMFDDRVEFHSPGRLPNTVTIALGFPIAYKLFKGIIYIKFNITERFSNSTIRLPSFSLAAASIYLFLALSSNTSDSFSRLLAGNLKTSETASIEIPILL